MSGTVFLVVVASFGVDFGWQPTADGDLEYIVQIGPELLDLIKDGEQIVSEIPQDVRGGRRFRIIVGDLDLPRKGTPLRPQAAVIENPQPKNPIVFEPAPREKIDNRDNPLRENDGDFAPRPDNENPLAEKPMKPKADASNDGDFNPLDPPPAKPKVGFEFGDPIEKPKPNSFEPEKPMEKKPAKENGFEPLPDHLKTPAGAPVPIPDPDAARVEPKKIVEPVVNDALPLPAADPASDAVALQTGFAEEETKPENHVGPTVETHLEKPALPDDAGESGMSMFTILVTMLLFASIGLNLYLGMLARTFYRRYREIAGQIREERMAA